jgi:phage terminase large subunit-like protein
VTALALEPLTDAPAPLVRLVDLGRDEQLAFIAGLTDEEALALEYDWSQWARASQLPPAVAWTLWLVLAGRGFGKTRTGAEWVIAESEHTGRIALVGATAPDTRDVMIDGESGILAASPPWNRPKYEPSKRRLTWKNGARAYAYSADEPERLRGPQHGAAWGDELAAWRRPEALDQLMFGLRLGQNPRAIFTTTPKPIKLVRDLMADPTCVVTRGSTYENAANLAPTFLKTVVRKYEGTRLGRQELNAEVLEDVEGALWTLGLIEMHRMSLEVFAKAPVGRTVIGVDPSVSSGEEADETGVVAAMKGAGICPCGKAGCLYIIDDASGTMPPIDWANAGVGLYRKHMADRVVAEVNNGGDLVETQFRVVDPNVSYIGVHAAKSKRTRAEPVQALYEQGRVHHVGVWPQLEDQLCTWVPNSGMPSPGRLDALVWALTELGLDDSTGILEYYAQQLAAMKAAP